MLRLSKGFRYDRSLASRLKHDSDNSAFKKKFENKALRWTKGGVQASTRDSKIYVVVTAARSAKA